MFVLRKTKINFIEDIDFNILYKKSSEELMQWNTYCPHCKFQTEKLIGS